MTWSLSLSPLEAIVWVYFKTWTLPAVLHLKQGLTYHLGSVLWAVVIHLRPSMPYLLCLVWHFYHRKLTEMSVWWIFDPLWFSGEGTQEISSLIQNYIREVEELRWGGASVEMAVPLKSVWANVFCGFKRMCYACANCRSRKMSSIRSASSTLSPLPTISPHCFPAKHYLTSTPPPQVQGLLEVQLLPPSSSSSDVSNVQSLCVLSGNRRLDWFSWASALSANQQ